jgi:hypothetical protein
MINNAIVWMAGAKSAGREFNREGIQSVLRPEHLARCGMAKAPVELE